MDDSAVSIGRADKSLADLIKLGAGISLAVNVLPYTIPTIARVLSEEGNQENRQRASVEDFFSTLGIGVGAMYLGIQAISFIDHPSLFIIPAGTNLVSAFYEAYRYCNPRQQ